MCVLFVIEVWNINRIEYYLNNKHSYITLELRDNPPDWQKFFELQQCF